MSKFKKVRESWMYILLSPIIQLILIVFQMLITFVNISEKLNWERKTSPFGGEDIVIVNLSKGRVKQDGLEILDFSQIFY